MSENAPFPYGRVHNFNAGPGLLPLSVVEEVRDALPNFAGTGLGLLEMSHRTKPFEAVVDSATTRIRRVLSLPSDYAVLFLGGGASLQFYMTALNLLKPGQSSDYLVTGTWSQKAIKEAARIGDAKALFDDAPNSFKRVPRAGEFTVRDEAVYLHYTSNNTIYGTAFDYTPDAGGKLLVADHSSSFCGVPIEAAKHDVIYAGAQKNVGPAGVTLVILSPRAQAALVGNLPAMLDYKVHLKENSLYNTPNVFGIYVVERIFAWLEANGGLDGAIARNRAKKDLLYGELDRSGFWSPHAEVESRSWMNVTWRLPTPELEAELVKAAKAAGLEGLKGHRSVGGIRASLYNALELSSVDVLVDFLRAFEKTHG